MPTLSALPQEDYLRWVSVRHSVTNKKKRKPYSWKDTNSILVIQDYEAKVFYRSATDAGVQKDFVDTTKMDNHRWRPPLVDEDWHALCQAVYVGVDQAEWLEFHGTSLDTNRKLRVRYPCSSSKAKTLWRIHEGKVQGEDFHDKAAAPKISNRNDFRQVLQLMHM